MADTNKVKYGICNVYFAVATIAANGTATYTTPKALPGAVSISLDQQGETNKFFADNIVYYTSVANNGYEGDLEVAKLNDDFLKDILGYGTDANGILYEDAGAPVVHFALIFQFEGDAHARRHVLYNCTCNRPSVSGSTKEDSVEPQTETITITATTIHHAGLDKDIVKASVTPTETTQYNAWNSTVYMVTST